MSFVRTTSVTMPRDEAAYLLPGRQAFNTIGPGRKFIAQSISGLVQTHVWRSTNASGKVLLTIFTEWATMEDLLAYANNPTIKEMENLLTSDNNPLVINVYEVIA